MGDVVEPAPERGVRREAICVGALVFALAAPVGYVAMRVVERLRSGFPDPTLVLTSTHVAFYWRAGTATWWGVLLGVVAGVLVRRAHLTPRRAGRAVVVVALPLVLALAVLAYWLP